jgi:V/A-type H+-transporting ATPase subunit E
MSYDQIEALKEEIWRRARERADQILREAEAEASRIIEEAKRKVEESARSRIEPEKLLLRRRLIGRAISEGRRLIIMARDEVVERAFEKALEKLRREAESKSEAYVNFLHKSLEHALEYVSGSDTDEVIIYANESDLSLLADMVKNAPVRVRLERSSMIGGVNVSSTGGRKSYYGSIESRLEALKPMLREKVANLLFREGGGG